MSSSTTGHQKSQKGSGVSVGKHFFPIFFLNDATAGTPRHICLSNVSHANIQRSDLPMLYSKWNITRKLDPTLKPSTYEQLRKIHMLSAQKLQCPRRFKEIYPEILHTCSTCPSRDLTSGVFSFYLISSNTSCRTQFVCICA